MTVSLKQKSKRNIFFIKAPSNWYAAYKNQTWREPAMRTHKDLLSFQFYSIFSLVICKMQQNIDILKKLVLTNVRAKRQHQISKLFS